MVENVINNVPGDIEAVLARIEAARAQGLLIHDMMDPGEFPGVTDWLATQGRYTTVEPRYPPGFWEFRKQRALERELGTLTTNATVTLGNLDEYKEAQTEGRLVPTMLGVLNSPRAVRFEDEYIADPKVVDGTVTAEWMTFVVGTIPEREFLRGTLQVLTRLVPLDKFHEVRTTPKSETGQHTVGVSKVNEYTIREIEAAVARIVAHA